MAVLAGMRLASMTGRSAIACSWAKKLSPLHARSLINLKKLFSVVDKSVNGVYTNNRNDY
jgi:hypothetical protein